MNRLTAAYLYAARRHTGQTRKGEAGEPYINHVIEVADRVARSSHGPDELLILGALLHDIVEDTEGTEDEIAGLFGADVASLVMEVTDDKSLPKAERKRLQIEHAPHRSDNAKRIKLADKASNLIALAESPPVGWEQARMIEYIDWAEKVIAGCRGVDAELEKEFDRAAAAARKAIGA
jgi:guanosine-3',5'-bis(diphosphate) 3'-pyrophosphohydrolase